jgi:hypothetical protein
MGYKKLFFGLEKKLSGPYGPYNKLIMGPPEKIVAEYIEMLVKGEKELPYIFVSSKIESNWWADKHLLVLDCDGVGEMAAACHWLKTEENIRYETIESTPGRFWVVTEYINTWKYVWRLLKQIPGVCNGFRYGSVKDHKQISIRAFPKLVNSKPHSPIFPDKISLNPVIVEWIEGLRAYFESALFKRVTKAVQLVDKLNKNAMEILAADPNFQV